MRIYLILLLSRKLVSKFSLLALSFVHNLIDVTLKNLKVDIKMISLGGMKSSILLTSCD